MSKFPKGSAHQLKPWTRGVPFCDPPKQYAVGRSERVEDWNWRIELLEDSESGWVSVLNKSGVFASDVAVEFVDCPQAHRIKLVVSTADGRVETFITTCGKSLPDGVNSIGTVLEASYMQPPVAVVGANEVGVLEISFPSGVEVAAQFLGNVVGWEGWDAGPFLSLSEGPDWSMISVDLASAIDEGVWDGSGVRIMVYAAAEQSGSNRMSVSYLGVTQEVTITPGVSQGAPDHPVATIMVQSNGEFQIR